jgi:hypothetical protein
VQGVQIGRRCVASAASAFFWLDECCDKLKLERNHDGFRFIDCDEINDYNDVF